MAQEGSQQHWVGADVQDAQVRLHGELMEFERGEIGEAGAFGVTPDQFDGVELGGVGWQQLSANAMAVVCQPAFDRFTGMGGQPIPDQDDGYAQRAAQLAKKRNDVLAVEARVGPHCEAGMHAPAAGRDHQGANDRELAPRAPALRESGGMSARCPAAAHQRGHQEAGFVYEDDRRAAAPGVFFTRGQSSRIHRRISRSSRSAARRTGFCGLQPKSCSKRPT